jgi:guanylate kinase
MQNHPDLEKLYPGNLFMVVAPSGAGKSSLVNALLAKDNHIHLSVSYTTRPPRPMEQNGREYHFVSLDEFKKLRDQGDFLEWAEVHGNFYATSRSWIAQKMSLGTDILMEIDWQGARQVRQHFQNAVEIFILPPSIQALEERLKKRGQDALDTITRRLLAAGSEIAHAPESDYVIINQNFEQALSELESIVKATRLRVHAQRAKHTQLFAQLGIH